MYNLEDNDGQTRKIDTNVVKSKSVVAGEEVVLDDSYEDANADSNTIPNSEKKKIDRKLIIGLVCIVAVILCVVLFFVLRNPTVVDENGNVIPDESKLLSKIGDTYEGLNYSLTKEEIANLGFFYNYTIGLEGSKIEVSYQKVDGLKDAQVQDQVNTKLKEVAESLYDTNSIQDENVLYDHVYNYTDVYIFNNVVSTMYCREKCDVEGNITYEYKGVNIELKNNEAFTLKDIFINTANVEEITGIAKEEQDNVEFCVSPKFVYVVKNNKVSKIKMFDYKDQVVIYNRYSDNKKMFTKTYNAKPYVYTTKKFKETDIYGFIEDNVFVDTYDELVDSTIDVKVLDAVKNCYTEAVNKSRNLAYSNPSKRYLVQIVPSVKENEKKNYDIKVEYNVYEIDKEFYNNYIEEFVVTSENKGKEEIEKVNYFDSPVLDGKKYLKKTDTTKITKEVDKNGVEVKEIPQGNDAGMGIS